jgi:hypothetical protein
VEDTVLAVKVINAIYLLAVADLLDAFLDDVDIVIFHDKPPDTLIEGTLRH